MKSKILFFFFIFFLLLDRGMTYASAIPQEFYISSKGEMYLRGGEVKIKNALNVLMVEIWGQRWTSVADYATKYESRYGEVIKPEEIMVGHLLEVRGKPMPGKMGEIDTMLIRDLSIESGTPKEQNSLEAIFCTAPQTVSLQTITPQTSSIPITSTGINTTKTVETNVTTAPPYSNTLLTSDLVFGMRGDLVKLVQLFLMGKGYDLGTPYATGFFGQGTLAAVKKFQKASGLKPLGRVGPATRALIDTELKK